jgi:hypothetical protein
MLRSRNNLDGRTFLEVMNLILIEDAVGPYPRSQQHLFNELYSDATLYHCWTEFGSEDVVEANLLGHSLVQWFGTSCFTNIRILQLSVCRLFKD